MMSCQQQTSEVEMPTYKVTVPAIEFEIEAEPDEAWDQAVFDVTESITLTPDPRDEE
jgi:hypothetical protein